jgi:hypothetical protein
MGNPKNKVQKSGTKLAHKKHQSKHDNSPPKHHNFTTKNHHVSPQISRTTLKKASKAAP